MTAEPPSPPLRLFSVDDHEIVQTGLQWMAERHLDLDLIGATSDIDTAVEDIALAAPDLVLLDLFIGEEHGWPLLRQLRASLPDVKVIVYTGYGSAQLVDRAVTLGAHGFILKSTNMSALPDMLRSVARTGQLIDPTLLPEWVETFRRSRRDAVFSEEELQILTLIAAGLDNHAIGEKVNLSFHTVKFHIAKMLRRTGEANRAGLVRFAKENFIVD